MVNDKPKIQVARQMMKIHDTLPTNLNNLAPENETPERNLEVPVGPAMPCVKHLRIPTAAKAPTQKSCSVKRREGDPQH